ncbi:unnamed protein product, partial [marine sediment metagenome]
KLKKFGKNIAVITPIQAIGAWVFVAISVLFLCTFCIALITLKKSKTKR